MFLCDFITQGIEMRKIKTINTLCERFKVMSVVKGKVTRDY